MASSCRTLSSHRASITLCLLFVTLGLVSEVYAQECRAYFRLENQERRVFGSVNVECDGCDFYQHTWPWGNWGVNSPHGGRVDGTQFKGWKYGNPIYPCLENISESRPQWNSCTGSFSGDYYMNWPESGAKTSQRSPDVESYTQFSEVFSTECPIDWDYDGDIDDGGCWNGSGARQISLTGEYMKLYELDANEFDDYVTTLNYMALVINTSCDGWSCTSAYSGWVDSNSNSKASAQVRAYLIDMSFSDPNSCCQDGVNYCL